MQDAPDLGWLGIVLALVAAAVGVVTAFMPLVLERMRRGRSDGYVTVVDEAMDDLRRQRDELQAEAKRLRKQVFQLRQENAELKRRLEG